jgi:hypothetical protein
MKPGESAGGKWLDIPGGPLALKSEAIAQAEREKAERDAPAAAPAEEEIATDDIPSGQEENMEEEDADDGNGAMEEAA